MGDLQRFESRPMLRLIAEDGTLIDPDKLPEFEGVHIFSDGRDTTASVKARADLFPVDARRIAGMKFLADVGLTLDDRLMGDDVQDIIDSVLFNQGAGKAA